MSTGNKVKEVLTKGALCAAVGGLGAATLFGETGSVSVMGNSIPSWGLIGIACGASSAVADTAKDFILPHLPHNEKWASLEGAGLALGASGLSTCLILRAAGAPHENMLKCVGFGASTYIAGDFIYSRFIDTSQGGILF